MIGFEQSPQKSGSQPELEAGPDAASIREQLNRILADPSFAASARVSGFLRYAVERALAGETEALKESVIGVEVFEKDPSYDPRVDPIVRVMATRLRKRLSSYYETPGANDPIRIEFPKGSYTPRFLPARPPHTEETSQPWWRSPVAHPRTWITLVVVALLLVSGWILLRPDPPRASITPSLAVLPLDNFSGDPDQEYLADGLTEALIAALAQIRSLRVISRTSAMRYKDSTKSLVEIARELDVEHVLEGSISSSGNQIRVTAQLIEVGRERHLWAQTYERNFEDVLSLQSEVARAVADQVRIQLTPGERARLSGLRPVGPEALKLYLLGRYHWNRRTPADFERSIEYFQGAIARDPSYAPAYAGLADAYNMLGSYHIVPIRESHPKARQAALKALEIAPDLAEAQASLATIISDFYWDWDEAEQRFRRSLELNPNYATARMWFAQHLVKMARWDEAEEQVRLARASDPLSLIVSTAAGYVLRCARRDEEAVEQLERTLEMDSRFLPAYVQLGLTLVHQGNAARAVDAFEKASAIGGDHLNFVVLRGYALAKSGRRDEARKVLAEIEQRSEQEYVPPYLLAVLHCGLGNSRQALNELDAAYAERNWLIGMIAVEPAFDALRDEPRFVELLNKMDLSEAAARARRLTAIEPLTGDD